MALYEFYCPECDNTFERILRSDYQIEPECPLCGCGKTERLLSTNTSFEITGEGVYKPGKHY